MLNKKGAMFGLDARIALAIFGALSVISGAALYTAIQEAKVTRTLTQLTEVEKAVESFLLDTGHLPGISGAMYNVHELYEDTGDTGWSGPYLSLDYDKVNRNIIYKGLSSSGDGRIEKYESDTWGVDTDGTAGGDLACDAGDKCSVWIGIYNVDRSIAEAVDLKVDGVADFKNGRIRLYESDSTPHLWLRSLNADL
ncbi:MAG TPA: hypothetical protein DCL21_00855 [Alphaproteobacteria bacterium]|nr:hypothetical protein [Alphaproteobacteria bacterium]